MPRLVHPALAVAAVLVLPPVAPAQPATFPDAKHGNGEMTHLQGVPVLTVRGTPTEIGEQFGVLAVKNAPDLDGLLANFTRDAKIDKRMGFVKLMARRLKAGMPADHLAEIEAGAEAGNRDLDLALFANTVYDISSGMGCSTLIVEKERSKTGSPLFGRNFDWLPSKGITEHTLIAVFHPHGKRSFAIVTVSPIVGCISGMNDAGLSVTLNEIHLYQSADKAPFDWSGTPIMLAYRRVLEECGSVAEAEKLLRGMKRTTSACMTICDKDGGAVFEITPKTINVRACTNGACCCTNHFRSAELATEMKCWRFEKLVPTVTGAGKLGVADVFDRLSLVHQGKHTLQSMVFEPAERRFHFKYGSEPATKLEAKTFELGKLLDQK